MLHAIVYLVFTSNLFYRSTARTKVVFRPWEGSSRIRKKAVGGHCHACVQASSAKPYRFQRPASFSKKTWTTYLNEKLIPELLRSVRPVKANTQLPFWYGNMPNHVREQYLSPSVGPTRLPTLPHIELNPRGPSGPGSQLTSVENLTTLAHRSRPIYGSIARRAQILSRM